MLAKIFIELNFFTFLGIIVYFFVYLYFLNRGIDYLEIEGFGYDKEEFGDMPKSYDTFDIFQEEISKDKKRFLKEKQEAANMESNFGNSLMPLGLNQNGSGLIESIIIDEYSDKDMMYDS